MAGLPQPTIGSYQPSDAGPWRTTRDEDDVPHVTPEFGPKHDLTPYCWCRPVMDMRYTEGAWSHFSQQ